MKRVLRLAALCSAVVAALVLGQAGRARAKPAGLLEVLTGFSAKETCSCAFVVDQTDAYCKDFGTPAGYELTVEIDRGAKTATSSIVGTKRVARFTEGAGCLVDPLP